MGALDDRGFLFLRGRKDDLINVGGLKVYPEEIRRVLERFPPVREAAVLGVKDARGEEIVYAVVSLKSAATENDILRFCRQYLLDYKIPRRVEIRDELPRGPGGKVRLREEDLRR
jgi:long-chain acyl-CoA synthetase